MMAPRFLTGMTGPTRPADGTEKHGFKVLVGTSQGSVFDLPPKDWLDDELFRFGASSKLPFALSIS